MGAILRRSCKARAVGDMFGDDSGKENKESSSIFSVTSEKGSANG